MLLISPGRPERDFIQAIAWLELAAERELSGAKSILELESPKLTESQTAWVRTLKSQLLRR